MKRSVHKQRYLVEDGQHRHRSVPCLDRLVEARIPAAVVHDEMKFQIVLAVMNPMLGTPNSLPFYALGGGSLLTAIGAFSISIRVLLLGADARPQGSAEESVV